jgi:uncharacterized Zn-binding protein involved in type VI secretion
MTFISNSIFVPISKGKKAIRLGDISAGHYPWPPRDNDQASTNVFVNGLGWHRLGDHWLIHCAPPPVCHDGVLSLGSNTVFINNKQAGRIGDPISCGDFANEGSPNVFCGDNNSTAALKMTWHNITSKWNTETNTWRTI